MIPGTARRGVVVATLLLLGGALLIPQRSPPAPPAAAAPTPQEAPQDADEDAQSLGCRERPLRMPSGAPPRLTCDEARSILAEMHARYAGPSDEPSARSFPMLVAGWLDPHGLWSAAPDAPVARALERNGAALLAEVREAPHSKEPCHAAELLGAELQSWVAELERIYDSAQRESKPVTLARGATPFAEAIFQDDPVTRPGRVLARRLGERAAQFSAAQPGVAQALLAAGKARYFPELSAQAWAEAVLAAAVRAYVPLLDPHGAWAPFDEEWSLYAEDPGFDGSPRLWGEVTRTAVGVRVLSEALSPLEDGDLVLSVDGVPTAGMPLEQIEQLGRLEPEDGRERRVLALHGRDQELSELLVNVTGHLDPGDPGDPLEGERIRFGGGHVLVVRIPDVPEGLGESLGRLIAEKRDASLLGVVLDLRGNGGGSTEAAADVVGLFLPGVPLFPLATRGRLVEVMRAPEPEPDQRYTGPVAAIVDGYTASAAEMIAGALSAYGRGVLLGRRTFGKGCIQEYADDHTGRGVLRVTTLLYALPNGSAVQRAGLLPDVILPVGKARDREADVGGALPGYTGPDVRDLAVGQGPAWPQHRGDIGHASDLVVTSALRRLGARPITARAFAARRSNSRTSSAAIAPRP
jgi:carboxyl-terminal processing protease